ncbi:hypothetical protein DHB64_15145 [Antarcticibacterium sp. W02-3]|nr:hypothetical protein [Antarcticibacterium sp. W02-3]
MILSDLIAKAISAQIAIALPYFEALLGSKKINLILYFPETMKFSSYPDALWEKFCIWIKERIN